MSENTSAGAPAEPVNYAVFKMACGYWISQSLYVVTKLGIPDLLAGGPKTAEELAAATSTDGPSLYRVLRALATQSVFVEDPSRRFRQTPISECLLDRPGSQRAMVVMMGEEHYRAYGDLMYSVRTGKPCFDHVYGMPIFDYLSKHPEAAATFDAAMTGIHGRETAAMIDAYDFSKFRTVIDIGGGNGTVLRTVLEKHSSMQGVLYDLPHVIDRARPGLAASPAGSRCQLVGGSFFESVPEGADAYMMRHIIHDWNDEQCRTILGHCRRAMKPEARLLVIDAVIKPGNEPQFSKFLDITMLALPGGKERTEAEFRTLFQSAGFELTRIVPTTSEVSIIEGKPA
jgi:ubiquinone/menaquinone biosynthesis C-methylase UbiE